MVFEMGEFTSQNYMYIFIVCVCLFVLFLSSFQKKRRLVLGLVERGILGFVTIIGLDQLFSYLALDLFVGVNVWTLLTSTILGIPGVCMLFCMHLF